MNIYNGNIIMDTEGSATVVLPDYFKALNGNFRYQLTVINKMAQAAAASHSMRRGIAFKRSRENA
jgi:hypothetical protein